MSLTRATVIAAAGLRIGPETQVRLSDAIAARFASKLEVDKKGKPKMVKGCHVLASPITVKRGVELDIDLDTISRRQEDALSIEKADDDSGDQSGDEVSTEELEAEAREEWATLTDEQKAGYESEAAFVADYVGASSDAGEE
ncbi:hypothetical protein [Hyphococcus sp.]|uniref:hypothetical protein n=1 Tax=Hyphococcus sp. TaxID=2038636 RepID=UPI002087757C|nr:MAG: hypothetical protein DHS20C04_31350 [Marinicaulis sp.]